MNYITDLLNFEDLDIIVYSDYLRPHARQNQTSITEKVNLYHDNHTIIRNIILRKVLYMRWRMSERQMGSQAQLAALPFTHTPTEINTSSLSII